MPESTMELEDLRTAIEQLHTELSSLVGTDYPAFSARLDTLLQLGDVDLILDLFSEYPAAHSRLLDIFVGDETLQARKGSNLFGEILTTYFILYYRCQSQLTTHIVELRDIEQRSAAGQALCPRHLLAMEPVSSQAFREAIEQLRPELPLLVGIDHSAFVITLDSLLRYGNDEQLAKLFMKHADAHKRLLAILSA
jgi:hypothetical protein